MALDCTAKTIAATREANIEFIVDVVEDVFVLDRGPKRGEQLNLTSIYCSRVTDYGCFSCCTSPATSEIVTDIISVVN